MPDRIGDPFVPTPDARWPAPLPPEPPRPEPRRSEPVHIPSVSLLAREPCPKPGEHYACDASPGTDPASWTNLLNQRFAAGYQLARVVAGEGTGALLVFEHFHG